MATHALICAVFSKKCTENEPRLSVILNPGLSLSLGTQKEQQYFKQTACIQEGSSGCHGNGYWKVQEVNWDTGRSFSPFSYSNLAPTD